MLSALSTSFIAKHHPWVGKHTYNLYHFPFYFALLSGASTYFWSNRSKSTCNASRFSVCNRFWTFVVSESFQKHSPMILSVWSSFAEWRLSAVHRAIDHRIYAGTRNTRMSCSLSRPRHHSILRHNLWHVLSTVVARAVRSRTTI